MPIVSQAQRGAMYEAAAGHSSLGIPKSVGQEFVSTDKPGDLPEHVSKHAFGGGIGFARGGGIGMHLAGNIIPHGHLVPGFSGATFKPHADHAAGLSGAAFKPPKPEGVSPSSWTERSEARGIDKPAGGGFASGGGIGATRLQDGGEGEMSPWFERQEARNEIDMPHGGFLNSAVAGRTDRLPLAVAADSHVQPADVISGLGQGNSLAGANVMKAALQIGPYGDPHPQVTHGHGPPRAPGIPGEVEREMFGYAEGGGIGNSPHLRGNRPMINMSPVDGAWQYLGDKTPLEHGGRAPEHGVSHTLMAGGEMVIPPHDWTDGHSWYRGVQSIGEGDIQKGHARLRELTKRVRKHTIKFLLHAPPPKK